MSIAHPGEPAQNQPHFGWIKEAWQLFASEWVVWIAVQLVLIIPVLVIYGVVYTFALHPRTITSPSDVAVSLEIVAGAVMVIIVMIVRYAVATHLALRQVRGLEIAVGDMLDIGRIVGPMLLYAFIYGLCILVGTFVLAVGAFVAAGILLPVGAMVADGIPIGKAIDRAMINMKPDWLRAAGVMLAAGLLIGLPGQFCCFVLLVDVPLFALLSAIAYRDMIGMPGIVPLSEPEPTDATGVWPPPPRQR